MSRKGFIRNQVGKPYVPEDAVEVPDPCEIARPTPSRPPVWVWVLLLVGAIVALMVMLWISGARQLSGGAFFLAPVMLISLLGIMRNRMGSSGKKAHGSAINEDRADYMRSLDEQRVKIHAAGRAQATEIAYHHPDPTNGSLATLVGTGRMWERTPNETNFGHVRLGLGVTRLKTKLQPPTKVPPPEFRETVTTVAARDLLIAQNVVHDVPRPLHLFDQMGWAFFAEADMRATVQGLLRSLIFQLCVFHGPDDVKLAIISEDEAAWEWAKWLPHVGDDELVDACGPVRLIFPDVSSFMERVGESLAQRGPFQVRGEGSARPDSYMVVVVDLPEADCSSILGVQGRLGVSVLEATGDETSVLANGTTAFFLATDEHGTVNLLKAAGQEVY
ncbi:cell division protein FtsK [Mycolicibacterium grossiae]|uniref:Cell division protein FtsK n=1 Tax=Mycolicibacterium grossiae TaxID=1552759 RepID=A0A1E8Q2G0_9MYCO|nr:cell division protein FtsK [Mycolicibacterium grossiae]OFJ52441.1 cell division protein FtsK [Mycolicibacterium grossiae]